MSKDAPQISEVSGESLSPLDRFWLDTARNAAKESVGALEEAAKQMIAVASFSQTIYFAAISFSDFKKTFGQAATPQQWAVVAALVIPFVFWIASLVYAVLVFKPETYRTRLDSPDLARETYREIVAYKHKHLQRAHIALVLGFIPLVVNVVVYLALAPAPPK